MLTANTYVLTGLMNETEVDVSNRKVERFDEAFLIINIELLSSRNLAVVFFL